MLQREVDARAVEEHLLASGILGQIEPSHSAPAPIGLIAVNAAELMKGEIVRPVPILEPILYQGNFVFFTGRPKIGKSWWTLQIALALAEAGLAGGRFAVSNPVRVLYLALEEPQWRTQLRLDTLGATDNPALSLIDFVYEIDPLLAGGAAALADYLGAHPDVQVVIVDTWLAFLRQAGRKNVDIVQAEYNAVNTVREIAQRYGVALIAVNHERKGGGDITESMIGTTGASAACDALWRLQRGADGIGTLEVIGREIGSETFELTFRNDAPDFGWNVTAEGAEVGLSEARAEIVGLLKAEGALKPGKVALLLRKNASTIRTLLTKLAYEGVLQRDSSGSYLVNRGGL